MTMVDANGGRARRPVSKNKRIRELCARYAIVYAKRFSDSELISHDSVENGPLHLIIEIVNETVIKNVYKYF